MRSKGESSVTISSLKHCSHQKALLKVNVRTHDACSHPVTHRIADRAHFSCMFILYICACWSQSKYVMNNREAVCCHRSLGLLLRSSAGYCWCRHAKTNKKLIIQLNRLLCRWPYITLQLIRKIRDHLQAGISLGMANVIRIWAVIQVSG